MPESRHGLGARPPVRLSEVRDASRTEQVRDRGSSPPSATAPDPLIGRVVNGRFRILSLVARGGMGKVYKAEQVPLGRVCALKVLNPNYDGDSDPEFHRRFFLEAATAAKLTHPNTVTVFDYGKADDDDELYYIAMEFIEGKTLHRVLREQGPFSEARTAHVARQICRSLREAHSLSVVHRDLKPANILLVDHGDERDNVKVLDFGLVKDVSGRSTEDLTQQGLFMGSPKYMAPEQIVGSGITQTTDIYSLGVMLYEMLTGKVPFDKGKSVVTLMAHVNEPPPPLEALYPAVVASQAMRAIVARCLEKDPTKRYASMNDLLIALKRAGGDEWLTDTNEALPVAGDPSSSGPRSLEAMGLAKPSSGPHPMAGAPLAAPTIEPLVQHMAPAAPTIFASPSETLNRGQALSGPLEIASARRSSRKGVVLGVAVVAALGVGGLAFLKAQGDRAAARQVENAPAAQPATATPPVAAVAGGVTAAAPTAPAPAERVVRIESEPAGATVTENDRELCASTPCEVKWTGDAARAGALHALTVAKAGYHPETLKVGDGDTRLSAKLMATAQPAAQAAPARTRGGTTKPPAEGYRDNPYK
jgi:serine/threonine-protein kinase